MAWSSPDKIFLIVSHNYWIFHNKQLLLRTYPNVQLLVTTSSHTPLVCCWTVRFNNVSKQQKRKALSWNPTIGVTSPCPPYHRSLNYAIHVASACVSFVINSAITACPCNSIRCILHCLFAQVMATFSWVSTAPVCSNLANSSHCSQPGWYVHKDRHI